MSEKKTFVWLRRGFVVFFFCVCVLLGIEPRTSSVLDKCFSSADGGFLVLISLHINNNNNNNENNNYKLTHEVFFCS